MKTTKKSKKSVKVQDYKYWAERSLSDKEKDWLYGEKNWLEGYELSVQHEHREQIIEILKALYPFGGVLEMGCNVGPNLLRISQEFPENQMSGYDINEKAIERARELLPKATLRVGLHGQIPFSEQFDIVLADATLLYVPPDEIEQVMDEINRVAKKAVILVERYAEKDEVVGNVWGRNYKKLLENRGFSVSEFPVLWDSSENWKRHGRIWVGKR